MNTMLLLSNGVSVILVFDMDDTLYDELTFVHSGFRAVAADLAQRYEQDKDELYGWMHQLLVAQGRGAVFDEVLKRIGRFSIKERQYCVGAYRHHHPLIALYSEAERCLARYENHTKFVVTDGHKVAQHQKAQALGLYKRMDRVLLTHRFGVAHAKPSTYCFHRIASWTKCKTEQIVYIGDNPNKDFVRLKQDGFKTVRVLTGQFADLLVPDSHEAHRRIANLDELTIELLDDLFS